MTLALTEDPSDYQNATYLARACDFAYYNEAEGKPRFAEELGLDARLVSVDNTQAYVATNDAVIVVAFRGSESPSSLDGFKDWLLTNASNFLVLPEGELGVDFVSAGVGARFHKGFISALNVIWTPLFNAVDEAYSQKERPIWVTGHSLGGAIALLAAWRFTRHYLPVHGVITFGAPMIGNEAAAEAFARDFPDKVYRYVDALDMVPMLPRVALLANAYVHCIAERVLGEKGVGDGEASAQSFLTALASSTAQGVLDATIADELWGGMQRRIAHHMVSSYLSRLQERMKAKT